MRAKKKLLIILLLSLFLFMMLESSFAANNETNIQTINNNLDNKLTNNDLDTLTTNQESYKSNLNANNDVKVKSTNDYYYDASTNHNGTGIEDNPYNDFTKENLKPNSINHLKNGKYNLDWNLESSDITFIGETVNKTIINCNANQINVTKNLKLINITLTDFTIRNEGTIIAKNTIFDGGFALKQDDYGNSYGGAIYTPYNLKTYKVNIDNCTFKECIAAYGGAIYMDGGELNIKDSQFIDNLAYNYGGAIAAEYNSKLNINKTSFINNKAFSDAGGAIYLKSSNLDTRNIEIINSTATFGAAITALNSKLKLYKLIAENNIAEFEGGAIYQMYGEFSMQQSKLINNTARNGGAIYIDNVSSFTIPNNIFENNTAKIRAGAAYVLSSPKINFLNKYINNNAQEYPDTFEIKTYDVSIIGNGDYELIINNNSSDFNGTLPEYYDLRDYGYVTPVKNQEAGGNCWAFSALAALESCILKATGQEYDLSEENMKNLIQLYSDYGLKLDTNDGAYISTGLGYLASWLGPINEINDTYDDHTVLSPLINSLTHIQNILLLKRNDYLDNDAIKEAIMRYGAVGTGIGYDSKYFNPEKNSYYAKYVSLNHAVTIVGWNDTYSKYNFKNTPDGNGAWIVKNSWGTSWGDNGYFYVSYYDWNIAKMGLTESSFTFILNETMKYDKNYQYDVCGKTSYSTVYNDIIWYQNIFTATNNEALAAVSTYFEKETNWTISILVNDILKLIKNGTSKAGYYTINLCEIIPLKTGDTFKITFQIQSGNYTRIPISEVSGSNKFLSHEGLSYFSYDGETWIDLYKSLSPSVACIKAFTILNLNTTIDLKINYTEYNPVEITATITDEYGRIIKEGEINFKLDGHEFNIPIINGQAKLIHNFTNTGINTINAIFNPGYTFSNKTHQINIKKIPIELNLTLNQDKNNININLKLSQELNSKIKVLINNNENILNLTNGQANLKLNNLTNGNYTLKAILEDSIYEANKTEKFQIKYEEIIPNPKPTNNNALTEDTSTNNPTSQTTTTPTRKTQNKINLNTKTIKTIKKSANKLILTATLKINKKPKKGKTIIFIVNGKKFKIKTNKNGIAKLTIKKSVLKKLLKKVKVDRKIKYQIRYCENKVFGFINVKK